MSAPERRSATLDRVAVRSSASSDLMLSGYASLTGVQYEVAFFTETIARGAFKRTLAEKPDVSLLLQHGAAGTGLPLARTTGGTLRLAEDTRGLAFEADLAPDDPDTAMVIRKLARGDLNGAMSFAFIATDDVWSADCTQREIKSVGLHRGDVSLVVHPANESTYSMLTPATGRSSRAPDLTRVARQQLQYAQRSAQLRDREKLRRWRKQ